jgi:hypothetical protein
VLDQLLHPPGRYPEQNRRGDHADQGLLGLPAMLQQPIGGNSYPCRSFALARHGLVGADLQPLYAAPAISSPGTTTSPHAEGERE